MSSKVETFTPPNTPAPIGPYSHVAKTGQFVSISATAGVDPSTGQLAGTDVYSQTNVFNSLQVDHCLFPTKSPNRLIAF